MKCQCLQLLYVFFFSAPVLRERVKKAVKVIGAEFHEM